MQKVAVSKLQDPGSMHGGLVHHVTAAQAIGPASALARPPSAMLSQSVRMGTTPEIARSWTVPFLMGRWFVCSRLPNAHCQSRCVALTSWLCSR